MNGALLAVLGLGIPPRVLLLVDDSEGVAFLEGQFSSILVIGREGHHEIMIMAPDTEHMLICPRVTLRWGGGINLSPRKG